MTRLLWTVDKRLIGVVLFLVVSPLLGTVYTYTRGGESTRVYAATASTLNFQARLMASNGSLVADGNYSIEFKLYTAVTGGSNEWTATQAVTVKNGYFNTQLGSAPSPFPGTIDWSQEKWLTMNINGDGEMTPRIKLTAVPYAFRSGQADSLSITGGTITGDNLLQKAPGSVQSLSSANAGLRFNQTGAGGLIQLQTGGLDAFTVNNLGAITAATSTNTINGLVINAGALSSVTGITFTSGNLALGGGNITGAGSIAAGNGALNIDTLGNITTAFTLLNGSSTTNGTSGIGGASSTSMVLTSATNFDIGNYVRLANANCGGAGVNVCYAKITNKVTNTISISPALVWANGSPVTEYRVPELGGTNGSQPLQNRFGRGYFISGIATGNGTTFYNEDSISTSLSSFSIADENVATLRIGGQAGDISIGNASTTVSLLGSLTTSLTETITAGGGLIVSSGGANITGGANLNSGGITNAGAISGVAGLTLSSGDIALGGGNITGAASIAGTSLSVTGAITAATSGNTINGLVVNAGALSNITGITFTSGGLNVNNGGITNAGAISGIAGLTLSSGNLALGGGNITGAGSISGTSLGLSGAITGATATNTINGLIINAGALSGITGFGQTSGAFLISGTGAITIGAGTNAFSISSSAFDVSTTGALSGITTIGLSGAITGATTGTINGLNINAGALSGVTTLGLSGAITGATTTNTINGLIINAGALNGITGYVQSSGNFAISGTGTFGTGTGAISLNGTVTASAGVTVAGMLNINGSAVLQTGDSLTVNGDIFTDFTGAGLIRSAGSVLNIDVTTAGTVTGTTSNSGLITAADGLSLLRGCANNQILKWATGGGGSWSCAADGVSDARLKKNIEAVDMSVLSRVRDVALYNFDYDCDNPGFDTMHCDTNRQFGGVLAQELQQLFPELVIEVNGFYQVNYNALSMYNLKALGELADQVDVLALSTQDSVTTGGVLRMNSSGTLQNINGLNLTSGGASIVGGLNNNNGGITNVGILSGITNISAQSINLAATADQNLLTFTKDGAGVFTVFNSGALQLMLDDTQALGVKSANGNSVLNVDTLTGRVKIGAGVDSKTVLFVLDSKSTDGDPAGVNGAQYYNAKSNKFRCYQNNKWQDCLQTAYSEYSIMTQRQAWAQPSGDHELPGENRTWIDLSNANQIRMLINMPVAAANNASCKLQFSLTEDTPNWQDIAATGKIATDKTGSLKSDWLQIKDEAKKEVLVRTYCTGGDGIATPEIAAIRAQVR